MNEVKSKSEGYSLVAGDKNAIKAMFPSKNRNFAFISTEESLKYGQMLWGDQKIYMTSDLDQGAFFIDLLAIPVQKSFPYRSQLNRAIIHLLEGGIFDHWQDLEYRKLRSASAREAQMNADLNNSLNSTANNDDEAFFDDFDISQLQSFFFLYLFGIAISIATFIAELLYTRLYKISF